MVLMRAWNGLLGAELVGRSLLSVSAMAANKRPSSDMAQFREKLKGAKHAHVALAECERRMKAEGKELVVITQNIDELHRTAGTENILELHGSLFKVRCVKCEKVTVNRTSPICSALSGKGAPDPEAISASIPENELPRCESCGGLLRPHVVWFGEGLDPEVMHAADWHLINCDLCLVVGTSSVVYPAAMFAPQVAARGVPVAEFNIEDTPATSNFGFHFNGPASQTLPEALKA